MDTNDVEKKLDVADSVLTKIKVILKKHWGILLFLLFSYCTYWAFTQPAPVQEPVQQYVVDTLYTGPAEDTDTYYEDSTVAK